MITIKTITYKDYRIDYHMDEDPINPREWGDNFGRMACYHPRYELGDYPHPNQSDLMRIIKDPEVVSMPLYLLEHSGLYIRAGRDFSDVDPGAWDSGLIGYIYAKPTDGMSRDGAMDLLHAEVELYNAYISGDVYGFTITAPDGELVDSMWGFYCWDRAKSIMESQAKEIVDEHQWETYCDTIDARSHALTRSL